MFLIKAGDFHIVKSPFFSAIVVLLLAVAAPAAFADKDGLTVFTPRDRSYVESDLLSVVLICPRNSFDSVTIEVNGKEYRRVRQKDGYYVCAGITLSEGPNRIRVKGVKDGKPVAEKDLEVFYRVGLSERFGRAPAGFDRYYFHVPENEKNCIYCHQLGGGRRGDSDDQSCKSCHRRIVAYRYVHGPASVWACGTCHDKESKNSRYDVRQPYSSACYECHADTMDSWNAMEHRHGPYSLGNCTICHSPHASNHPFFTRRHTTDLCLSCHVDKATGAHVVTSFAGRGHPVRGKPDPLNPGKELTCASCHNPHASRFGHLLFQDESDIDRLCKACHKF